MASTQLIQGIQYREIPRVENLDRQTFADSFLKHNRPVVFKDMAKDWPALTKWNKEYFTEKYAQNQVKVYDSNFGTPGGKYMSSLKTMNFADYLDDLESGETTLRMFLYNIIKEAPELKDDLDLPTIMDGFSKNFMFMFFGAKGSITQLHYDIDMSHVFHTAFSGIKRFYLFAPAESKNLYRHPFTIRSYVDPVNPDFERYPKLKDVVGDYVELQAGETLFIPAGYWHHVVYDEPSYALSLRCAHQSLSKRAEGIFNILCMQMLDRLINKINAEKWFDWKKERARLLAEG
jgi:hypothetical protein